MEILAATSSVAGLISLLNQTILTASKLREIFSNVSHASTIINRFLHDVDSLLQALHGAKGIVDKLPQDVEGSHVTSLTVQLECCTRDVFRLLEVAGSLGPVSGEGAKPWCKRFRLAMDNGRVVDAWEELGRHRQAIDLNLAVLGRMLDLRTASRIDQGMTASLSKIEEQNATLDRIEVHSEASLKRSAISECSLHSIATSLSRIEALATSVVSDPKSPKGRQNSSPRTPVRLKRRSTGEMKARRRSGGHVIPARLSNASATSLPAVPAIPENHLSLMEDVCISEISEETLDRGSSCRETQTPWTSMYSDPKLSNARLSEVVEESRHENNVSKETQTPIWTSDHAKSPHLSNGPRASASSYDTILTHHAEVDISLHQQHRLFHRLTQETMAVIYPPIVIEYIALTQVIKDYESKIDLLNLLKFGSNIEETINFKCQNVLCDTDLYVLQQERNALRARLATVREDLRACRRRCIFEGHSLHDIDRCFNIRRHTCDNTEDPSSQAIECLNSREFDHPVPTPKPNEILTCEILDHSPNLLGSWSNKRDRINRWLLHSLASSEEQTQLHQSMLADPPINDRFWSRQLLTHWYVDGAATEEDLQASLSAGAEASDSRGDSPPHNEIDPQMQYLKSVYPAKVAKGENLRFDDSYRPLAAFNRMDQSKLAANQELTLKSAKGTLHSRIARIGKAFRKAPRPPKPPPVKQHVDGGFEYI